MLLVTTGHPNWNIMHIYNLTFAIFVNGSEEERCCTV